MYLCPTLLSQRERMPASPVELVVHHVQQWCMRSLRFRKGMAIASRNVYGLHSCLDEVKLLLKDLGIHFLA